MIIHILENYQINTAQSGNYNPGQAAVGCEQVACQSKFEITILMMAIGSIS